MDYTATTPRDFRWRLLAAMFVPFVAVAIYLLLTRRLLHHFTAFSDYASLAVAALLGAAFVATLPIRTSYRAWSVLIYLPVVALSLFLFTFVFIAAVFHDAL